MIPTNNVQLRYVCVHETSQAAVPMIEGSVLL